MEKKIQDFGMKIEGARKDKSDAERIKETKKKLFPGLIIRGIFC